MPNSKYEKQLKETDIVLAYMLYSIKFLFKVK